MVSQMNEKVLSQESHQRDKYLGCSSCKGLGTVLKQGTRRIQTNISEDKVLHPRDDVDRLYK